MTRKEATSQQRRYQRQHHHTWTSTVVYSGREREGLHYIVHTLDPQGKEHHLYTANERVGSRGIEDDPATKQLIRNINKLGIRTEVI